MLYYRAIPQIDVARPRDALTLAGGWAWFTQAEVLSRDAAPQIIAAADLPADVLTRMTAPRAPLAGLDMSRPQIMGIVNTTPDSFSDGGKHAQTSDAIQGARAMAAAGADILDIGGESTRPGADFIPAEVEITRTAPVIAGLRAAGVTTPISIDTRKAAVGHAALAAGAGLINDVSGFTFDADLAPLAAKAGVPVCVMHAQGDPATMQQDPQYDDVLLDVYDFLAAQIDLLTGLGTHRSRILADPGIGFGKTLDHNLALLHRLSLFHTLGVPILLGASRKRFIGTLGNAPQADARAPGSIAVALAGMAQGAQVVRVHDVAQTVQARALWQAVTGGGTTG